MPATAAMKRGIQIAKEALERQGYELVKVDFSEEQVLQGREVMMAILTKFVYTNLTFCQWFLFEKDMEENKQNHSIVSG